jgi:D-serine deaminase-like pyridoxal phosphate-dependent protein
MDYLTYKHALSGERLPQAIIDLDSLEANATAILARSGSMRIRIASKSVRSRDVLQHLFKFSSRFQGLMTFTAEESLFLARHGFDDLLLGYPTTDVKSILELSKTGKRVTFMVDSVEHLNFLASLNVPLRICLDVDMSTSLPGLWFGVRRSSLRTLKDVQDLVKHLPSQLKLVGVMGYEAQVAGLGDKGPQKILNPIIRYLQRISRRDYAQRRGIIVSWLKEHFTLEFVNGGGTGSLEWTKDDPGVDELTVGSGFYSPGLFDHYSRFHHRPAAFFAIPIVRKPTSEIWTCLGGGYVASGEINVNKRPVPFLPTGLKLIEQEGTGEVQTPVKYTGHEELSLGDPLFFRHAKAGELCERFNDLLVLRDGKLHTRFLTYRGEGHSFL